MRTSEGGGALPDLATKHLHRLDARSAKRRDERSNHADKKRENDTPDVKRRALVAQERVRLDETLCLDRELPEIMNRDLPEDVAERTADECNDDALHQDDAQDV